MHRVSHGEVELLAQPRPSYALGSVAGLAALASLGLGAPAHATPPREPVPGASTPVPARPAEAELRSPDLFVEVHFHPVPGLQIAIWLTDENGEFVQDAYITQATGKLGIGNRPGIWNFLSSWRAPYGPRRNVLPYWGHAREVTYPQIIFHDERTVDSLGFHEQTSSYESYFCRPLLEHEQDAILDSMTCPSPQVFRTDKGQFAPDGGTSIYPPRNDLAEFDEKHDSVDTKEFGKLNELDALTQSTPRGNTPEIVVVPIDSNSLPGGIGQIWIEVNLEADENDDWSFDRDDDHFVDPRLDRYGLPFLGQPAISYMVEFDIEERGYFKTDRAEGYAAWDGSNGELAPIDDTISTSKGSGVDRLQLFDLPRNRGQGVRLAVYNHGLDDGTNDDSGDEGSGQDSGSGDAGSGDGGSVDPGTGTCRLRELPGVENFRTTAIDFDTVEVEFTVPESVGTGIPFNQVHLYYQTPAPEEFDPSMAVEASDVPPICHDYTRNEECINLVPGQPVRFEVDSLWGNYDYAFGISYEDRCTNESPVEVERATTPAREFQTIDSFCFVATAAYGAPWVDEVESLRDFRDTYLKTNALGREFIDLYYAYGPAFAHLIGGSEFLRGEARSLLRPLVDWAQSLPTPEYPPAPRSPATDGPETLVGHDIGPSPSTGSRPR